MVPVPLVYENKIFFQVQCETVCSCTICDQCTKFWVQDFLQVHLTLLVPLSFVMACMICLFVGWVCVLCFENELHQSAVFMKRRKCCNLTHMFFSITKYKQNYLTFFYSTLQTKALLRFNFQYSIHMSLNITKCMNESKLFDL